MTLSFQALFWSIDKSSVSDFLVNKIDSIIQSIFVLEE